jgi:hypothetical protein
VLGAILLIVPACWMQTQRFATFPIAILMKIEKMIFLHCFFSYYHFGIKVNDLIACERASMAATKLL